MVKTVICGAVFGGCILASVTAEAWGATIAEALTPQRDYVIAENAPEIVRTAHVAQVDKPEGEDPNEDNLIAAALVEQGYFRDDVPLDYELQDILHTACEANGIPYHVALGLIYTESHFDVNALNRSTGCYGACQLNPLYFPSGLSPAENITHGINYLGELLAKYGTLEAALQAYHDGHDTGRRGYANTVLAAAEDWK